MALIYLLHFSSNYLQKRCFFVITYFLNSNAQKFLNHLRNISCKFDFPSLEKTQEEIDCYCFYKFTRKLTMPKFCIHLCRKYSTIVVRPHLATTTVFAVLLIQDIPSSFHNDCIWSTFSLALEQQMLSSICFHIKVY